MQVAPIGNALIRSREREFRADPSSSLLVPAPPGTDRHAGRANTHASARRAGQVVLRHAAPPGSRVRASRWTEIVTYAQPAPQPVREALCTALTISSCTGEVIIGREQNRPFAESLHARNGAPQVHNVTGQPGLGRSRHCIARDRLSMSIELIYQRKDKI